ncbi:hypothetical protein CP8484711_0792B, partial [Chlamydia psittaci 84-8471/1]
KCVTWRISPPRPISPVKV